MPSYAGSFLVAKATLGDPNFKQTVVFLLQHDADGAFGLVVNRPGKAKGLPFPIYTGGPCPAPGLLMLHGHRDWVEPADEASAKEAAPGIFVGDAASLQKAGENPTLDGLRFRVFSGYAGWGPNQLERELGGGDWGIVPATRELLFDTPPGKLWELLVPPRIPQPSLN